MYAPPIPVKPPAPKIIDVRPWFCFPLQTFILSYPLLNIENKRTDKKKRIQCTLLISFLYLAFGRNIR